MRKVNASKSLLVAGATALLAAGVGFFLTADKGSGQAKADKSATTEAAAAAAGAQVTPTPPKLKVEPK